jgi:transposase-like protein
MAKKVKKEKKNSLHKRVLRCPQCGGTNIIYESGFITGYKYHCKDCDYIGALIIEEDIKEP